MDEAGETTALSMMLRESVSFGRFESDSSLAWERWSVFSRNRLMEEVQKYAVPGSVAQKKAYFDAYYKRKRAQILTESLTVAGNAQSGAADAPAGNEQESLDETSKVAGLNKFDLCEERSGSCSQIRSLTQTLSGVDGRGKVIQPVSDASRQSRDMFEGQNQTTTVELHSSNKSGSQSFKENFDINQKVSIPDGPKKASSVSSIKPCSRSVVGLPTKSPMPIFKKEDYVTPDRKRLAILGTPMKSSVSPARHVTTPVTVPKRDDRATPKSKGFGLCIPRFRNKATINVEGVEPRTPIDKSTRLPTRLHFSWNRNDRSGSVNVTSPTVGKITKIRGVIGFCRGSYCSEPVCLVTKELVSNSTGSDRKKVDSREKGGFKPNCKNLAMTFKLRTEERTAKHKEFSQNLEEKAKAEEEAKRLQYRNKNKMPCHYEFKLAGDRTCMNCLHCHRSLEHKEDVQQTH